MVSSVAMSERELSQFSQTLQTPTQGERASQWVLNAPEPPGLWRELVNSVREIVLVNGNKSESSGEHSKTKRIVSVLESVFPILVWSRKYTAHKFKKDLMAGLTLASLCIPQVSTCLNNRTRNLLEQFKNVKFVLCMCFVIPCRVLDMQLWLSLLHKMVFVSAIVCSILYVKFKGKK